MPSPAAKRLHSQLCDQAGVGMSSPEIADVAFQISGRPHSCLPSSFVIFIHLHFALYGVQTLFSMPRLTTPRNHLLIPLPQPPIQNL
jgi:hypothetical protein